MGGFCLRGGGSRWKRGVEDRWKGRKSREFRVESWGGAARIAAVMSSDPLLQLLRRKARISDKELADLLSMDQAVVAKRIADWKEDGTILGYHAVVDPEVTGDTSVSAFIEVKVTPERGGGFDRLAMRVARFEQVVSCYLASGGYDLMVVVEGSDLREVARFVSEKLSSLEGVISTATHFRLKTYKENGFLFERESSPERLAVSP